MISLDWKYRLKEDTEDFFKRKLSNGDFDIEIIYNAYPERIDGKIPKEVITFVAKTLAGKIARKPEQYIDFFNYLWKDKGESGRIALCYILARAVKKQPDTFLEFTGKLVEKTRNEQDVNLLLDKTLFPLLKEQPEKFLDRAIRWLKFDNPVTHKAVVKLLIKLCKQDEELISLIFKRLESLWLYADAEMVKANSQFLKAIYKLNPDFYIDVYRHYTHTRNPVFVEILSGAIVEYDPVIEEAVSLWVKSGNARLKKAAVAAERIIKRKKN